ncbi:MAG TPA: ABC transporter ATP-binding protein [Streptosporangiaceae bacterium]|nr:ABC transporter ATP-binding protein [Streptosporangiaceae bacterium]
MSRGRRTLLLHVLRRSLTSRPRDAAWLAFWSSVQALPALASGWVVAKATGDFIEGRAGTARGLEWLGVLGLAAVVGALASRQTYLRVAALVEPVRDDLVRLVVSGALNEATRDVKLRDTGAVARITHQAEIVRDSFAGLLAAGLTFAFTAVSGLVGLGMLVPAVLPFAAAPVGVSLLLFCCLLWPMATRQRTSVLAEEALANSAAVGLAGLRDAIACGAEHHVRDEILDRVSAQATALRALARMSVLRTLCLAVGGWLPLILVLAAAPSLMRGGVSPGAIIGAVTYISGALQRALYTLTQGAGGSGIRLSITLQRILEASGYPQDLRASGDGRVRNTANGSAGSSGSNTGAGSAGISLRGVSFAYGPHAEPVLRAVDLDIADGDHVAVVGPSGIGKSTFAGLVAGLLRPSAGEIRIGPALLSEVDGADLPRLRVLIPQEAYVFAGTLGENLRYLAPGASAAELDASVDAVGLRPLASRVGGYCADLTPSVLSAGERQLIALVRAHLSPARLAILDEATCQLDPDAAARAESAFAARPGTLIVVAHRISSALRARQVLVLDGASVRLGDHMALRTSSPMYRDLLGEWHAGHDPVTGHPRLATACSGAQGAEPTVVA